MSDEETDLRPRPDDECDDEPESRPELELDEDPLRRPYRRRTDATARSLPAPLLPPLADPDLRPESIQKKKKCVREWRDFGQFEVSGWKTSLHRPHINKTIGNNKIKEALGSQPTAVLLAVDEAGVSRLGVIQQIVVRSTLQACRE